MRSRYWTVEPPYRSCSRSTCDFAESRWLWSGAPRSRATATLRSNSASEQRGSDDGPTPGGEQRMPSLPVLDELAGEPL